MRFVRSQRNVSAEQSRHAPDNSGGADLTHVLGARFPAFTPGDEATCTTVKSLPTDDSYVQRWSLLEHSGTHVDAPSHFRAGGRSVTDLRLDELLMVPAVVVDMTQRAAEDPDAEVTVEDLRRHESGWGRIPDRAIALVNSGWASKVGDVDAYRGCTATGLHFPGFGVDAVEWLVERRDIRAVGIDTLSIDPGRSTTWDAHRALLGADRYALENLANLHLVPSTGAALVVGVIPFEDGSGGPARVMATW